jgi:hypothetical protein
MSGMLQFTLRELLLVIFLIAVCCALVVSGNIAMMIVGAGLVTIGLSHLRGDPGHRVTLLIAVYWAVVASGNVAMIIAGGGLVAIGLSCLRGDPGHLWIVAFILSLLAMMSVAMLMHTAT